MTDIQYVKPSIINTFEKRRLFKTTIILNAYMAIKPSPIFCEINDLNPKKSTFCTHAPKHTLQILLFLLLLLAAVQLFLTLNRQNT